MRRVTEICHARRAGELRRRSKRVLHHRLDAGEPLSVPPSGEVLRSKMQQRMTAPRQPAPPDSGPGVRVLPSAHVWGRDFALLKARRHPAPDALPLGSGGSRPATWRIPRCRTPQLLELGASNGMPPLARSTQFLDSCIRPSPQPVDLGIAPHISVVGTQQALELILSQANHDVGVLLSGKPALAASPSMAFQSRNPHPSPLSLVPHSATRIGAPRLFCHGAPFAAGSPLAGSYRRPLGAPGRKL
jgi:hypothetical protein